MNRFQKSLIEKDLSKKMVFLTGPRQVGKTWLAKEIARSFEKSVYLNYDRREDREIIRKEAWLEATELLVLDELHKMPGWKNYLKGVFDTRPAHLKILVTGSARLETFRQGGDSLAGRFLLHRLLPFSPSETRRAGSAEPLERFMTRGGFPEPFLAESDEDAARWRNQYIDGLIRTDILDFENVHDFRAIHLVFDLVRARVGSPVSYSSIAGDVGIAPNTVKKYIQIFEALYIVFRVPPLSRDIARALKKEPKLYLYDSGLVKGDEGARLENTVALCLLKNVYGMYDYRGAHTALHYLRTKDGEEIDFCIAEEDVPRRLIEVKRSDPEIAKSLRKFHERYGIPAIQAVMELKRERVENGIEIRRALDLLQSLDF
ncbi:MAG: ATP-binding protein [Spirochaetes bacterium]|nr:MAG: ATP-binding protein [Spirochaetota bacterium]